MTTSNYLQSHWDISLSEGTQYWIEALHRLDLFDGVAFAYDSQSEDFRQAVSLAEVLRLHLNPATRPKTLDKGDPPRALLGVTIERLEERIRHSMEHALSEYDLRPIPHEGVLQYFSDDLRFSLYVSYRARGRAVQIENTLPIINPVLLADPLVMLEKAIDDAERDTARRFLYQSSKVVLLRNTLVHVDRQASPTVFGPSIDTLIVADWLLTNRFATQRQDPRQQRYLDDPMGPAATLDICRSGTTVLEIGTGSGLILATFTKNEATLHAFDAIDVSVEAVTSTYINTYRQRQIHGGWIGDRGAYLTGKFDPDRIHRPYDIVICNPPYIPLPTDRAEDTPYGCATLGTRLLEEILASCDRLIDTGRLYLVISDLTLTAFHNHFPSRFVENRLTARRVPFQVESAQLERNPSYIRDLKRLGLKERRSKQASRYSHQVLVFSIKRRD